MQRPVIDNDQLRFDRQVKAYLCCRLPREIAQEGKGKRWCSQASSRRRRIRALRDTRAPRKPQPDTHPHLNTTNAAQFNFLENTSAPISIM
jgi:hypothetical protein